MTGVSFREAREEIFPGFLYAWASAGSLITSCWRI